MGAAGYRVVALSHYRMQRDQPAMMEGSADATGSQLQARDACAVGTGQGGSCGGSILGSSRLEVGGVSRLALMLTPQPEGAFIEQAREVLGELRARLGTGRKRSIVTLQTVFLKNWKNRVSCDRLFRDFYGADCPAMNFVAQAPCNGAALAVEAWAVAGSGVRVERHSPHSLSVCSGDVRWIYCSGIHSDYAASGVHAGTMATFERLREALRSADCDFGNVVRTWFYLGGITRKDEGMQRYKEFNRARSDYYQGVSFTGTGTPELNSKAYPASTGIGMRGNGLTASCMAVVTRKSKLVLLPLENPSQTPAFDYDERYSPKSPRFSRAMAMLLGRDVTTWVSGTASITNSESRHRGDIEAQTRQTIENIRMLISRENFSAHGLKGAGALLGDLAKVRVYIKRPADFPKCKAVCEELLGGTPAIYALGDVCRPELLVEIEGVAFSRRKVSA